MIPADLLQNHLLLASQHISEAMEALENGDDAIVEASLADINVIVEELREYLPEDLAFEVEAKEMGMDSRVEEIAENM